MVHTIFLNLYSWNGELWVKSNKQDKEIICMSVLYSCCTVFVPMSLAVRSHLAVWSTTVKYQQRELSSRQERKFDATWKLKFIDYAEKYSKRAARQGEDVTWHQAVWGLDEAEAEILNLVLPYRYLACRCHMDDNHTWIQQMTSHLRQHS